MRDQITIDAELAIFELPDAVQKRLQTLLDKQQVEGMLSASEKEEAVGLVELSEFLSLLRLKHKKAKQN